MRIKDRTFIIAEAGVNHNGSVDLALGLVDAAKNSGADAIKFQTFDANSEINRDAKKASYQKINTPHDETLYEMTKTLELNEGDLDKIIDYSKKKGIPFFSSASDMPSIDLLKNKGQGIWKVASNLINDYPFLKRIGSFNQQVIVSTGMSYMEEVSKAMEVLVKNGTKKEKISLLQCNTEYPSPIKDLNLKVMLTFQNTFGVNVGLSDHSKSIIIPAVAVAMGASIIEKHLTLDKDLPGPDHKTSLDLNEFKLMVNHIREIESALGDGIKKPSDSEKKNIFSTRKSIVCTTNIIKGDIITEDVLSTQRPSSGINPMQWDKIIGTKAKRDFNEGEMLEME